MELKSLLLNGISWKSRKLGEKSLLLEPEIFENRLETIHILSNQIERANIMGVVDVIPAYQSLGIIFDDRIEHHEVLIEQLANLDEIILENQTFSIFEVPVCYDLGLDWERVLRYSGFQKAEFIQKHSTPTYTVAMMGFLPGFVFLDGLDSTLFVPRMESPRTNIPKGAIGIGGNQTGLYSLESPGGWNIIGRTARSFFDHNKIPPTHLKSGDKIRFISISKEEFDHD